MFYNSLKYFKNQFQKELQLHFELFGFTLPRENIFHLIGWLESNNPSRHFILEISMIKMSSIIESGCPEATLEVSGVIRMIEAIAFAKCPLTLSGICEFPESCIGCYGVIDKELEQ